MYKYIYICGLPPLRPTSDVFSPHPMCGVLVFLGTANFLLLTARPSASHTAEHTTHNTTYNTQHTQCTRTIRQLVPTGWCCRRCLNQRCARITRIMSAFWLPRAVLQEMLESMIGGQDSICEVC